MSGKSYTTVTSLTMTPDLYLEVGTTSYRATCWYKNLSYSDMSLFYQKQYLSFLMISIIATCCNLLSPVQCNYILRNHDFHYKHYPGKLIWAWQHEKWPDSLLLISMLMLSHTQKTTFSNYHPKTKLGQTTQNIEKK